MPELGFAPSPARPELLRQLRLRLGDVAPALRLVAEGMLGAESSIDFVGVEPDGRVVLVLVGESGEDLALIGRALAQKAWVEPRLRDWLQLAPGLALRPEAGVRVLLLCPDFSAEAVAAAGALGSEVAELAVYRCLRNGAGVETLLERRGDRAPTLRSPNGDGREPPSAPQFRTGLTDEDLELSADERSEFE